MVSRLDFIYSPERVQRHISAKPAAMNRWLLTLDSKHPIFLLVHENGDNLEIVKILYLHLYSLKNIGAEINIEEVFLCCLLLVFVYFKPFKFSDHCNQVMS